MKINNINSSNNSSIAKDRSKPPFAVHQLVVIANQSLYKGYVATVKSFEWNQRSKKYSFSLEDIPGKWSEDCLVALGDNNSLAHCCEERYKPKFKIGDTVKVINNSKYMGECTEIIAVDDGDADFPYKVDLLDEEGGGVWLSENDLVLYSSSHITVEIEGWATKDYDGDVVFHTDRPFWKRVHIDTYDGFWRSRGKAFNLPNSLLPNLTPENPHKVRITITPIEQ